MYIHLYIYWKTRQDFETYAAVVHAGKNGQIQGNGIDNYKGKMLIKFTRVQLKHLLGVIRPQQRKQTLVVQYCSAYFNDSYMLCCTNG